MAPTSQARRTLLALLGQEPRRISILPANNEILAMAPRAATRTVLALALGHGRISLWDLQNRRLLRTLENPGGTGGTVVAFSPTARRSPLTPPHGRGHPVDAGTGRPRLVSDGPARLRPHTSRLQPGWSCKPPACWPRAPHRSNCGSHAGMSRPASHWRSRLPALYGPFSGADAVAFTPDGHKLVAASDDETLDIVGLRDGRVLRTRPLPVPLLKSVAVSPDGRVVAAAGPDYTSARRNGIVLVDLDTGRPPRPPWWVDGTVSALAFSRDGHTRRRRRRRQGSPSGTPPGSAWRPAG